MKKMLNAAIALTLAASMLTASGALAQAPAPGRQREPTVFTFDDHAVGGDTQGPQMSGIDVRIRVRRDTLIQPRVHYVNEMLKSVEAF